MSPQRLVTVVISPVEVLEQSLWGFRASLHEASALRQLCDDICDAVLVENIGVAPE